eukprot:CAMPEP_0184647188 /NCGR_PEP_ID=MMETSP0308-20130426/4096_1 /TAXON_ID=38269 /ORGANISM="Gloeochaete witrockiana, Strain SAG 46.84" /LENGTH=589 /DNA_ID=CAMNT_0027077975 /DNA_START=173 /DNA_END=1942 /DNA_ORIENTATION=-
MATKSMSTSSGPLAKSDHDHQRPRNSIQMDVDPEQPLLERGLERTKEVPYSNEARIKLAQTCNYFINCVILGIVSCSLGPSLPSFAQRTGTTPDSLGYVFAVRAVGALAGSMSSSIVFDMCSGHMILAASLILQAIMLMLMPYANTWLYLSIPNVVFGLAVGVQCVGVNTLLGWVWAEKVEPWMNAMHFTYGVGAFLSPLLFDLMSTFSSSPADVLPAYCLQSALCILCVVFALVPSPRPPIAKAAPAPAPAPLPSMIISRASPSERSGSPSDHCGESTERSGMRSERLSMDSTSSDAHSLNSISISLEAGRSTSTSPSPSINNKSGMIWLLAAFLCMYNGVEASYSGWLYMAGIDQHASPSEAAYLSSVFFACFTLGRLLAVPLSRFFSSTTTIIRNLSGCIASLLLLVMLPSSRIALWVGSGLLGLCLASCYPTAMTMPTAFGVTSVSARNTSILVVGGQVGGMLVPLMVGESIRRYGPYSLQLLMLADILIASLIFAALLFYACPSFTLSFRSFVAKIRTTRVCSGKGEPIPTYVPLVVIPSEPSLEQAADMIHSVAKSPRCISKPIVPIPVQSQLANLRTSSPCA